VIRTINFTRPVTGYVDTIVGDEGFLFWRLNNYRIRNPLEDERTFDTFTFTFVTSKSDVKNNVRPAISEAGKVDVVPDIEGGFDAVDRSRGDNTIRLISPIESEKLRTVPDWIVSEYEEEPLDSQAEKWEVELELVPKNEKSYDNEYGRLDSPPSLSDDPNQWYLQFENGDILTKNVTTDLSRSPEDTFESVEFSFVPTLLEARVVEENLGLLNAQYTREVPDGKNVLIDESVNDRNTVNVSPPDGADTTVTPGDYVVKEWTTSYNQTIYEIEMVLVKV
jgi:hypothetical protein